MPHLRLVWLPALAVTAAIALGACSSNSPASTAGPTAASSASPSDPSASAATSPTAVSPTAVSPTATMPTATKPTAGGATLPDGTQNAYVKSINSAATSVTVEPVTIGIGNPGVKRSGKTYQLTLTSATGYYFTDPGSARAMQCMDADSAGTCKTTLNQVQQDLHDYLSLLLVKVTVSGGTVTKIAEYEQGG
jgi:hypothetical protein